MLDEKLARTQISEETKFKVGVNGRVGGVCECLERARRAVVARFCVECVCARLCVFLCLCLCLCRWV